MIKLMQPPYQVITIILFTCMFPVPCHLQDDLWENMCDISSVASLKKSALIFENYYLRQ
jgi:hypothetical protein